jgi:endo-1,3-1,4-beta-glycanase ExoK
MTARVKRSLAFWALAIGGLAVAVAVAVLAWLHFSAAIKSADVKAFGPLPESVTFMERFQTLDDSRWVFSDGWNNGTWMENDWRRDALSLSPEGLLITMGPNPALPGRRPYMSGELQSHESYLYGYFETRMRIPRGEGVVAGFFTYARPGENNTWEEIDIEFLGRRPRAMAVTYHVHGFSHQDMVDLGFDASQGFHIYGFEWTPDAVRWYVDNRLVHEVRDTRIQRLRRPQRLYLSLWNSTELYRWVGDLDPEEAPWTLGVSCIAHAQRYDGVSLCARRAASAVRASAN